MFCKKIKCKLNLYNITSVQYDYLKVITSKNWLKRIVNITFDTFKKNCSNFIFVDWRWRLKIDDWRLMTARWHAQKALSITIFSKWMNFQTTHWKKLRYCLKMSLHLQAAFWTETSSPLPFVQIDFAWALDISNLQNDRFTKPSDSLRGSLSTRCH